MLFPELTTEHERHWQGAISDDPTVLRQALDFWARRLHELPSPILFTVPKTNKLTGPWQRIVRQSDPYCACGRRRWLFPAKSAHFHAPEDPTPITVGVGAQLALGARGADLYQTQIQVSIENGYILTHVLPYSLRSHEELAAAGVSVAERPEVDVDDQGNIRISGTRLRKPMSRDSLAELASAIDEEQRPINRLIFVQITGANEALGWVMYQTTGVDLKANSMQVVVSATVQVMDRSVRPEPHICMS